MEVRLETRVRAHDGGGATLSRIPAAVVDSLRLAWTAVESRQERQPFLAISLTDPPFLPLAVGTLAQLRGVPWFEWSMDVYPEAFAALNHPLGKIAAWLLKGWRRWVRPTGLICLGPAQAEWLCRQRGFSGPVFLLPAGILAATPKAVSKDQEVRVVYAGNLGPLHPVSALIRLVQHSAVRFPRLRWVLAVTGSQAGSLRAALAHYPAVIWAETPLSWSTLAEMEIHCAGLRLAATHLCVPSKAVSALSLGRPLLWLGAAESDIWSWATGGPEPAGWRIDLSGEDGFSLAEADACLEAMLDPAVRERRTYAAHCQGEHLRSLAEEQRQALALWLTDSLFSGMAR
jgi:hypothetical protein